MRTMVARLMPNVVPHQRLTRQLEQDALVGGFGAVMAWESFSG
jgi:hypothetical protein